eukprot:TRINITY_DN1500_c0_g1_i1.p1 TRINITY_DN1500_c0_g1~~TRINITY_DN1500_c0_g1_i1.p1  ORF type:complete len:3180 (-),score=804.78 TRINITY_DN1500_c0_g1_i1:45-8216(-)
MDMDFTCTDACVRIYDGTSNADPLLVALSADYASLAQTVYTSSGPNLYIEFDTATSVVGNGFVLAYTQQDSAFLCDSAAVVAETSFPRTVTSGNILYQNNMNCRWYLDNTGPASGGLRMVFTKLDMTSIGGSCSDIVSVYAGADSTGVLQGQYCGPTLPQPLFILGDEAFVRFQTDSQIVATGFSAYVTDWVPEPYNMCSGSQTLTISSLFSDGSGDASPYDNNVYCDWLVVPDDGSVDLVVIYMTMMDLEYETSCNYDYYQVDFWWSSATTYTCGTTMLPPIVVPGDFFWSEDLYVYFVADYSVSAKGFRAGIEMYNLGGYLPYLYPYTPESGVVETFGWTYYHFWVERALSFTVVVTCDNTPNCAQIYLTPQTSELSESDACYYPGCTYDCGCTLPYQNDFFSLIGMPTGSTTITISVDFPAEGYWVVGVFGAFQGDTFAIEYQENAAVACSGQTLFNTQSGTVSDGSGAAFYYPDSYCEFLIQPFNDPLGTAIALDWTEFGTDLDYDFVTVYKGNTTDAPVLLRLTGAISPPPLFVFDSPLLVLFTSDSEDDDLGFSFNYRASSFITLTPDVPRTQTIALDETVMFSINLESASGFLRNFSILIKPASSSDPFEVFMSLNSLPSADRALFSLPHSNNAQYSIVQNWPTPGQYFVAVHAVRGADTFTITATSTPSFLCSGQTVLTSATGLFTDGSGAGQYNNSMTCDFVIQPNNPQTTAILLYFTEFNIEYGPRCEYDCIRIYSGTSAVGNPLGSYSGSTLPDTLVISATSALVRFTTDTSNPAAGFFAGYVAIAPSIPVLTANVPMTSKVVTDNWVFFQAVTTDLSPMLTFTVSALTADNSLQVYLRSGTPPTSFVYDEAVLTPAVAAPRIYQISVPWADATTWYIGVTGSDSFTVTLSVKPYSQSLANLNNRVMTTGDSVFNAIDIAPFVTSAPLSLQTRFNCSGDGNVTVNVFNRPEFRVSRNGNSYSIIDLGIDNSFRNVTVAYVGPAGGSCRVRSLVVQQVVLTGVVALSVRRDTFPLLVVKVTTPSLLAGDNLSGGTVLLANISITDFSTVLSSQNLVTDTGKGTAQQLMPNSIPSMLVLGVFGYNSTVAATMTIALLKSKGAQVNSSVDPASIPPCVITSDRKGYGACQFKSLSVANVAFQASLGFASTDSCTCDGSRLIVSNGVTQAVGYMYFIPSQGCVALRPWLSASGADYLAVIKTAGKTTCAMQASATNIESVNVLLNYKAGRTSIDGALEYSVDDSLFRVYLLTSDTTTVIETQVLTDVTDAAITNIYVNTIRGTLTAESTAFNLALSRQFSFGLSSNQVVLDNGGSFIVAIYGRVGGSYKLKIAAPILEQLSMGRTNALEMRDGFRKFFTWRIDNSFPSIGVTYNAAPFFQISVQSARQAVYVSLRSGRNWFEVGSVTTTNGPMKLLLQYEDGLQLNIPFVSGSEFATATVTADVIASLNFDESTSVVMRQGSLPVTYWQWQWVFNATERRAVSIVYTPVVQCRSTTIFTLTAYNTVDGALKQVNSTCVNGAWTEAQLLLAPEEFLVSSAFARRGSSTTSTVTGSAVARLERNGATVQPVGCSDCVVFVSGNIEATRVDITRLTINEPLSATLNASDANNNQLLMFVPVNTGLTLFAKGTAETRFSFAVNAMPMPTFSVMSRLDNLTYTECNTTQRTYYIVAQCVTGICPFNISALQRLVSKTPLLQQYVEFLTIPHVAARDNSSFFVTQLKTTVFPRSNVRVYGSQNFTAIGTNWGYSVSQTRDSVLLGQPQWSVDSAGVANIRLWRPLVDADALENTGYASCSVDAGAMVDTSSNGFIGVTVINATHVVILDTSTSVFVERAIFDISDTSATSSYLTQVAIEDGIAAVLVTSVQTQASRVLLRTYRCADNSSVASCPWVNAVNIYVASGVQRSVKHWMALHALQIVAVAIPELYTVYVYNVLDGSVLLTLTNPTQPQFGRTLAISPSGTALIVGGNLHALVYNLPSGVLAWMLPDALSTAGGKWLDSIDSMQVVMFRSGELAEIPTNSSNRRLLSSSTNPNEVAVMLTTDGATDSGGEYAVFKQTGLGQVWNAQAKAYVPCPPGTFKNDVSLASCSLCPSGTYSSAYSSQSCLNCTVGSTVCPPGSVIPIPTNVSTSVLTIPFPVGASDSADYVVLQTLFTASSTGWFWVAMSLLTLVAIGGLYSIWPGHLPAQTAVLGYFAGIDRDKDVEIDRRHLTLVPVGSLIGGMMTTLAYGFGILGFLLMMVYASSYSTCSVPTVPAYTQVFSNIYAAPTLTQNLDVCPDPDNRNIDRSTNVRSVSSQTEDIADVLGYLENNKNVSISLGLVGFTSWSYQCDDICTDGHVSLSTTGCLTGSKSCTAEMPLVCEQVDDYTCRVATNLPIPHDLSDTATFQFTFAPEVFASGLMTVVYSPSARITTNRTTFTYAGAYARFVQLPSTSVANQVLRGNVIVRGSYAPTVRQTWSMTDTLVATTGFLEMVAQNDAPTTMGSNDVQFQSTNIVVSLQLAKSQFWIDQQEGPSLKLSSLIFSMMLTLIMLFELTEAAQTVLHRISTLFIQLRRRTRSRAEGSESENSSDDDDDKDPWGHKAKHFESSMQLRRKSGPRRESGDVPTLKPAMDNFMHSRDVPMDAVPVQPPATTATTTATMLNLDVPPPASPRTVSAVIRRGPASPRGAAVLDGAASGPTIPTAEQQRAIWEQSHARSALRKPGSRQQMLVRQSSSDRL